MTEQVYKGLFKVIEECGELLQVCGKLGPFPSGNHPDGGDDLRSRLEDELADVEAAIVYLRQTNNLSSKTERMFRKLDAFHRWGLTGINSRDQP